MIDHDIPCTKNAFQPGHCGHIDPGPCPGWLRISPKPLQEPRLLIAASRPGNSNNLSPLAGRLIRQRLIREVSGSSLRRLS